MKLLKVLLLCLLLFPGVAWAADTKVTNETGIDAVASGDEFYCNDVSGPNADRKCTAAQIQTFTLTGEAATATALAANGANCSAGSGALGVDASGAAESCTDFEEDLANEAGLETAVGGANVIISTEIDASSEIAGIVGDETGSGALVFGTDPALDMAGGTLEIPNSITLPATCAVGEVYFDSDATAGQNQYGCTAVNTWTLQGDGSGSGNAVDTQVDGVAQSTATGIYDWDSDDFTLTESPADDFDIVIATGGVDPAQMADADFGDFTFSSGVGTLDAGVVDSAAIADDSIKVDDLDLTDTEADEECLTYEVTGTAIESQVCKQPGKETLWIPAAAMRPTVSNGAAALVDVETTAGRPDMTVLDFDTTADEHAQFQVAFPKSWNEGTITFQGFWSSAGAVTTGVAIGLQCVGVADNETMDVAYGTAVVVTDDAQSAAEELYVTAESAAVTIAGTPAVDEVTFCRVFRDVSDVNDDMTQDMRLVGLKLFYTTDAANDE